MASSRWKEVVAPIAISLPLVLAGCGTCNTGPECQANADRFENIGGRVSEGLGDIVEAGGELTGDVLHLLGIGADKGGELGGEGVRLGGSWLAEKTKGWANLPEIFRMAFDEANR